MADTGVLNAQQVAAGQVTAADTGRRKLYNDAADGYWKSRDDGDATAVIVQAAGAVTAGHAAIWNDAVGALADGGAAPVLSGAAAGGDLTGMYPDPALAASGVVAGAYGSGTQAPVLTVDAKGRVTAAANATIAGVAPGGAAGGVLAGTYPAPGFAAIAAGALLANNSGVAAAPAAVAFSALTLDQFGAPAGALSIGGQKLANLAQGSAGTDGVNLQQVMQLIATGVHAYLDVQAVAAADVNVAAAPASLDGYTLVSGDLVLLTAQSAPAQNGPWLFSAAGGALARPAEYASGASVRAGYTVIAGEGSSYKGYFGFLQTDNVTVDTTATSWALAPGPAGYVANAPLTLSGNQLGLSYGSGLGLSGGTLAASTGTSGHYLPFLDGANTWSAPQAFAALRAAGGTFNLNAAALPAPLAGTVLQLGNADGTQAALEADAFGAAASFSAVRYGGSNAAPAALQAGDPIGGCDAYGYNGAAVAGPVAAWRSFAAENWSGGSQGAYADVMTTPVGTTALATAMRFENDQSVSLYGSAVKEAATLGSELTSAGTVTSTGWSGSYNSYTNGAGNTVPLVYGPNPVVGATYYLQITTSGSSAGSVTASFGGSTIFPSFGAAGSGETTAQPEIVTAVSSSPLTFTPDGAGAYNGTISNISIRQLTPYAPVLRVYDSAGNACMQLREMPKASEGMFLGNAAGQANTTGSANFGFGNALMTNTSGNDNIGVGSALNNNTTGSGNVGVGDAAGSNNTTGNYNVSIGLFCGGGRAFGALASSYSSCISIGRYAGTALTTGASNDVFVGDQAGQGGTGGVTGTFDTGVGNAALVGVTSGSNNSAFGALALKAVNSGGYNVGVGYNSGANLTTGNYNICIGYNTNAVNATGNQQLNIGNLIFGTALSVNAGTPGGRLQIGTTSDDGSNLLQVAGNSKLSGTLTATGLITGQAGLSASGAAVSLNASSNFATNINTGSSTGTVTIGNAAASIALNAPATLGSTLNKLTLTAPATGATLTLADGSALVTTGANTTTINSTGNGAVYSMPGAVSDTLVGAAATQTLSNKTLAGLMTAAPATKTSAYSQAAGDTSLVFNGSGSITLTLLSPASYAGQFLLLKTIANQAVVSASSNVVPLAGGAGSTAILAGTAGKWALLQSDGSNWQIMAAN